MKEPLLVFLSVAVVAVLYAAMAGSLIIDGCNETQCASNVSKCLLMGACNCTMENCSCCANCSSCLRELWEPCCSCVGLCKPPNGTMDMSTQSTINTLDPTPSLFDILTENAFEGILQFDFSVYKIEDFGSQTTDFGQAGDVPTVEENERSCTVIFHDNCLSLEKCEKSCSSMGASRYRWFHTACCECIGHTCLSYGADTAMCKSCPEPTEGALYTPAAGEESSD